MSALQLEPGLNSGSILHMSALNSLSMNPSWTRVGANPYSDVGWSEFNPGWPKCGFHVSDCIHACVCASAVCKEEMTGRQQWAYSLAFGAQPMCRASLWSFEDFTQVSLSPCVYSPCIFDDLLVVSDGSPAQWLATGQQQCHFQEWQVHGVNNEQWTAMNWTWINCFLLHVATCTCGHKQSSFIRVWLSLNETEFNWVQPGS